MLTIGADPEIAVIDLEKERFVSSHDLVKGTKAEPFKVEKGAIQADGTMVEFNIDPAASKEEFQTNIETVLKYLRENFAKKYEFRFQPTVHYDRYYFEKIPEEAKKLGCSPDFAAWQNNRMNPPPIAPYNTPTMRTCSGHLHFGWTQDKDISNRSHLFDCGVLIRGLDTSIGKYQGLWDKDNERRNMYGQPGAFRPKPYGVEWRSLSNAWLNHKPLWPWLYEAGQAVFNAIESGRFIPGKENWYNWYGAFGLTYDDWAPISRKGNNLPDYAESLNKLMRKKIKGFPDFPVEVLKEAPKAANDNVFFEDNDWMD